MRDTVLQESRSASRFMSSDLPLEIRRPNSSAVKGNVSSPDSRLPEPKTRLNQPVSRRIRGSPPAISNALAALRFRLRDALSDGNGKNSAHQAATTGSLSIDRSPGRRRQ
jgi:hypothetical protein